MSKSLRRDLIAGGLVGLASGLVFGWAMNAQAMMAEVTGLIGLPSSGAGLGLHLLISILSGVAFGAIFRYQPQGYAASLSNGLLFGLLAWIAIPLTLNPLLLGERPTWSLAEAGAAFPGLVGYLLYGGLTGLGFAGLVTQYLRLHPETELAAKSEPARRVLILGGGYAGMRAAQRLEQIYARDPDLEITLVSQSNFLLFTPMLAEVAASAVAAQHISTPLRAVCPRTRFFHAAVEAIDPNSQTVQVRANPITPVKTLLYDQLVLALGAVPNFYGLPGLEANAFTLKTLHDATDLRNHVISLLERADVESNESERRRLLTFVVAGAGFAGVEILASLFDMAHSILRYYPEIPRDELRFILVHSQSRILPELTPELALYAQRKLENRGAEFVLGVRVTGATPDKVQLNDGSHLPTCTLIWTAGNQPNPLLKTLPGELDRRGAVVTGSTLRVKGLTNVWAVGDCAVIPDVDNEGKPFPPTAQHALREGKVVAENIAAVLRNKSPKSFRFKTIGLLVSLGHRSAAAEIFGHRFSGLLAWFMWRTIYWGKLPGLEKKMRVAIDWTIDLFFPRDIVLTR
jgi:NADH dehydrogenase